jgi:hypothetical protein
MHTRAMSEMNFKQLNGERLALLTSVGKEAKSAEEACDRWLATGHIGDYRAWQTRLRRLEEVDASYGAFLSSMR